MMKLSHIWLGEPDAISQRIADSLKENTVNDFISSNCDCEIADDPTGMAAKHLFGRR